MFLFDDFPKQNLSYAKNMKHKKESGLLGHEKEAGFSIIELIIVAAMVTVLTCYAVLQIAWAREDLRLTNSAQILSGYVEKVRLAATRCHCTSTVQILDDRSYALTGYLKDASLETLAVPLEESISFVTTPRTITFDWRGRTDKDYPIQLRNRRKTITVTIAGGGDITINSNADYSYKPAIQATLPTDLTDLATDSYVTSISTNNGSSGTPIAPPLNPKNHKKPKK